MAQPNKDDPKKNPEPNRAGTDINKNVVGVTKKEDDGTSEGTGEQHLNDDGSEITEEQKKQEEQDRKDYKSRMEYATKVSDNGSEGGEKIESEDDWKSANRLIADGLAKLHAVQVGMETTNYLILTDEGTRAVQAYNAEKNRD